MNHRRGSTPAKGAHKSRHWHLATTLLCCLIVRITTFYVIHVLQGSEYKYIDQLIAHEGEEGSRSLHKRGGLHKEGRLSNPGEEGAHYFHSKQNNDMKDLQKYFQTNKRNRKLKQFLLKNDSMHYSFNSDFFLSFDNFKLLLITTSFYLALRRIRSEASRPHAATPNLLATLFVNAMLLYVTSFHFILVLIGINNLMVYSHQGIMYKHKLKVPLNSLHMLLIILQNLALLIATLAVYALLLLASAYVNSGSWSFLNNTLINEYKVFFLLPNLGNYWYLFSTMFREYYHSFLFLFHFHVFLYPLPLLFRLVKTPLIYLKIMISIALVFHPNITLNDLVFSLLLLVIDYKRTLYAIPFAKLIV
ncbi:hypothetical protein PCYB_123180 [Plasmodium cynomolgi strain B]|uniref:GPI transamidase subunit PIG-U n=1 Tax=Plasmodium cynomolgi (strain B) TaxID=1120755 RepID=K6VER2_PLACD|nr:hypothetical protein PCYB_123180 [Plasmodium cynomolgi strain B]GAB67752.1 hypothetical protein PCYB_123180 [Plasmodium cynomolgi strain B]